MKNCVDFSILFCELLVDELLQIQKKKGSVFVVVLLGRMKSKANFGRVTLQVYKWYIWCSFT